MNRRLFGTRGKVAVLGVAAMAMAMSAGPASAGKKKPFSPPKRVYVQSNATDANEVQIFARRGNGKLVKGDSFPTGGTGSPSIAVGFPFTESSGSVTLSRNGRFLFVVNHGSNSVTSFKVTRRGLRRRSIVPSSGTGPLSVTVNRRMNLAYVVNEGDPATISGFRVSKSGVMSPLSDSTRTLAYPAGAPAQVLFSNSGKALVVSDRQAGPMDEPDFLESFKIDSGGRPTALPPTPSSGQTPFGFTFTRDDVMVVTNADNDQLNQGSVSTYRAGSDGGLTALDHQVTDQTATCWVVLTKNEKYAIVSNTVSFSLSSFRLSDAGGLTRVPGPPPDPAIAHTEGAPVELALARDGKFLYAANVDAGVLTNDPEAKTDIQAFRVRSGGRLESIGTSSPLATTYSGLAAW